VLICRAAAHRQHNLKASDAAPVMSCFGVLYKYI
jgi:hypothetical protein